MKTISINVSSKPIQIFVASVGGLFLLSAWYISQITDNTTDYLFAIHDIQLESFARHDIDSSKLVLDGETLREVAAKFNKNSSYGVVGLVVAGVVFLLLSLALSKISIRVDNREEGE